MRKPLRWVVCASLAAFFATAVSADTLDEILERGVFALGRRCEWGRAVHISWAGEPVDWL